MARPVIEAPPTTPAGTWLEGEELARRAAARTRRKRLALLVAGWAAMLGIWQVAAYYLPFGTLPNPLEVSVEMWEIVASGALVSDFLASVLKTFAGFGVAVLIGAPVGYLMGRYGYWRAFFLDGVTVAGTIPALTYAVLSLIIFGLSNLGPVLAVALVSTPYVALNVAEGIRGVDQNLVKMSQAFGRSPQQIRREVFIPTIVPYLFAAVRMSFAVAWKVEALTEVFGGTNGVGFQIRTRYQLFDITGVIAWMALFIVFMLLIERLLLRKLEQRVLAWRPEERAAR
ncbi:ABC transporter permease [Geodermatophilus ruber]|uniref:NitT/TauT family transport system permease protein n=1 Tax=Geodermatophilus ruber TaxID=504800 RepID=A0A1I4I6A9_9ACTN|nr:ABC transporter permease [Geodermatophilus ruber]SFL49216.1 NitT/TauT family transport system permease protein [Geodermatophilus ruber]